jgi:CubicO group peptidase (beta-lactamase class C family)
MFHQRIARPRLLLASWLLLEACAGRPSPQTPSDVGDVSGAAVERYVHALRDSTHIPALSVAVGQRGRILVAYAEGQADRERGATASPHTLYRLGSVSKLLTASVALRLAERGKLDLDAAVQRYVPEFPEKRGSITLRELAAHQSGIRHYRPNEFVNRVHYDSVAPSIGAFKNDSLLFLPGTRYFYSSFGYVLLSLAIERAAHRPFLDVIHREVLGPLGMRETAPDRPDSAIAMRAVPYDTDSAGHIVRAVNDDLCNRWAAGGYVGTVMDLARFGFAFLDDKYLKRESVTMMTSPQRLTDGSPTLVGMGWRIGTDSSGRTIWHHAGSAVGGRAVLVVWPEDGIVVAIAGNMLVTMSERTAFRFAEAVRRR